MSIMKISHVLKFNDDYVVACELAERWLARGDVLESRIQVDGFDHRVSVVDRFDRETVLYSGDILP